LLSDHRVRRGRLDASPDAFFGKKNLFCYKTVGLLKPVAEINSAGA
jgi:hypothetical protein